MGVPFAKLPTRVHSACSAVGGNLTVMISRLTSAVMAVALLVATNARGESPPASPPASTPTTAPADALRVPDEWLRPPATREAPGFEGEKGVKALYFDGPPYKGK